GILRRTGRPRWNTDYYNRLIQSEHFQMLVYSIIFSIEKFNILFVCPLIISAIVNIFEYFRDYWKIFSFVMRSAEKVLKYKSLLYQTKAETETFNGFFLIIGFLMGFNS